MYMFIIMQLLVITNALNCDKLSVHNCFSNCNCVICNNTCGDFGPNLPNCTYSDVDSMCKARSYFILFFLYVYGIAFLSCLICCVFYGATNLKYRYRYRNDYDSI